MDNPLRYLVVSSWGLLQNMGVFLFFVIISSGKITAAGQYFTHKAPEEEEDNQAATTFLLTVESFTLSIGPTNAPQQEQDDEVGKEEGEQKLEKKDQ